MDEKALRQLLTRVRKGRVSVPSAVNRLKDVPFVELGFATIDTHRKLRFGFPEVVLGESKTADQLMRIVGALYERRQTVLVTRLQPEKAQVLLKYYPEGSYDPVARLFQIRVRRLKPGRLPLLTPPPSDLPPPPDSPTTPHA